MRGNKGRREARGGRISSVDRVVLGENGADEVVYCVAVYAAERERGGGGQRRKRNKGSDRKEGIKRRERTVAVLPDAVVDAADLRSEPTHRIRSVTSSKKKEDELREKTRARRTATRPTFPPISTVALFSTPALLVASTLPINNLLPRLPSAHFSTSEPSQVKPTTFAH